MAGKETQAARLTKELELVNAQWDADREKRSAEMASLSSRLAQKVAELDDALEEKRIACDMHTQTNALLMTEKEASGLSKSIAEVRTELHEWS